jgi:hypothetical protein
LLNVSAKLVIAISLPKVADLLLRKYIVHLVYEPGSDNEDFFAHSGL